MVKISKNNRLLGFTAILLVGMILYMGVVSAYDFDNVKSFEKIGDYGKISINDCSLWLGTCLIEGNKISETEMTFNTEYCSEKCWSEFKTTLYSDNSLISGIYFIKSENGWKETNIKSYQYYLKIDKDWKQYSGEKLKAGTYEWKVEGVKNDKRDVIDFIPNIQGKDITEWAVWNSTFNNQLTNYWSFDETSGTNASDSIGGKTGMLLNGASFVAGKNGNGVKLDGINDVINITMYNQQSPNGTDDFTIVMWAKFNSSEQVQARVTLLSNDIPQDDNFGVWNIEDTGSTIFGFSSTSNYTSGSYAPKTKEWGFYVFTGNLTNISIYYNGTLLATDRRGIIKSNQLYFGGFGVHQYLGAGNGYWMNGTIDEVGIWNRTLSASEIQSMYDSGAGTFYNTFLTLNNPVNNLNTLNTTINFNCSATTNSTFGNTSLYINDKINYTQTYSTELFKPVNLGVGNYNWSCKFNTSTTQFTSGTQFFNISAFIENSQTYNATAYETSTESFVLNISYDNSIYTLGNSYLVYNGTNYLATQNLFTNGAVLSKQLLIPTVSVSGTNLSFYWNVSLLSGGTTIYVSSSLNNQTVYKGTSLSAGSTCPAGYSPALNFTSFYEQNRTNINMTTINYYFTYGLTGNSSANSINGTSANIPNLAICINNSQTYYNLGYGEIQYSIAGTTDRRYYAFSNVRLTNTTVNIPIYSLESYLGTTQISTTFLLTAQSTTLQPYVNYYIALMRWYPQINSYLIVDMGKTDDKGQTALRVKTEDVDYRIGVYAQDGTLIQLLAPVRMVCQTTPCTYSIFVDINPLDLTTFTNIQSNLSYDDTTHIFKYIWNDPSQASQTMNLTVWQDGGTDSTIICSNSASGYVGVLLCDVTGYQGHLRAEVTRTASPLKVIAQLILDIRQTFIDVGGGVIGLLIGAILLILFALIGTASPILVVILGLLALIPLYLLGNITWITLTGIGVLGGVVLHFIGRSRT